MDKLLEVGIDEETKEVVLNVQECTTKDGFWHITFTVAQARGLADLLLAKAMALEASLPKAPAPAPRAVKETLEFMQLRGDAKNKVVVDRDAYNVHRIKRALMNGCSVCLVRPGEKCLAKFDYELTLEPNVWVHTARESIVNKPQPPQLPTTPGG